MRTIDADEAKAQFDPLLTEVEAGETIILTRHGLPVARLSPMRNVLDDAATAIDDWRRYRHEHDLTLGEGVTIRELIEEGREERFSRSIQEQDDEDRWSL